MANEADELAERIARLTPGHMPGPVFQALAKVTVYPIVEMVPVRRDAQGQTEVLFLQRDQDDPVWPGQWHTPGTVVRASDAPGSLSDAFARIRKELGGVATTEPVFVTNLLHHSGRGMELAQVYWVELMAEPKVGRFCTLDHLPETVVQTQLEFITAAVAAYEGAA